MQLWKFYAFVTLIVGCICELSLQQQQNSTTTQNKSTQQLGLCNELQILRNTIPINRLIALTQRHERYDGSFRRAMKFVQTGKYASLARRIERSRQFQSMLGVFKNAGVNVTEIATIDKLIDCLLLPMPIAISPSSSGGLNVGYLGAGLVTPVPDMKYQIVNNVNVNVHNHKPNIKEDSHDYDYEDDYLDVGGLGANGENAFNMTSRSMQSLAMDILRIIPEDTFRDVALVEAKNNPQFGQFLNIVQSRFFQNGVMRAMNSITLRKVFKKLRAHGIDVQMLLRVAFKIFAMTAKGNDGGNIVGNYRDKDDDC